ncbi:MAG: hypothetical protein ABSB40_04095 [Nitrososphaeria archaeon]|jgi:hypothetical protein
MVIACKIFVAEEYMSLEETALKLKGFRVANDFVEGEQKAELVNEIKDLEIRADSLRGIFSFDTPLYIPSKGLLRLIPRTFEVVFELFSFNGRLLLVVFEKKERANNVANQLSKILFLLPGRILEVRIEPDTIKKYHEEHMEDAKVLFFDDIDIPNISKLSLYGSGLANTALYSEYLTHGKLWYIVVRSKKFGYIVGFTRNGIVVSFTKIEITDLASFVKTEIFPLLSLEKNG